MTYAPYPTYKPSGIPWLGDIPVEWDIWKITHGFGVIGSGTTPKSDNLEYYDGDIPWVTTSELREKLILDTEKKVTSEALSDHSALRLYHAGSLLIAMYGATIGRLGILGINATVNQACCVFDRPSVFDTKFVFYWLQMAKPILISQSYGGGQPNLSQDLLKQIKIAIPSISEQQAIAAFLDAKTAEIDALIAKKEALLTLLAEQRTALITQAVTKGLNPDVPTKPSDIGWLGDIPAGWEVKKLKFAVFLANEKIEFSKVDLPYMGLEHIESWTGNRIEDAEAASEGITQLYKTGDVLFGKLRPYLAKVYLADHEGACTTEALVLRSLHSLLPLFLRYYMSMEAFIKAVDGSTYGSKMPRANWDFIGNMPILLPPVSEQEKILKYLSDEIDHIDNLKSRNLEAINKLKEYRTALITNAVTGKIKVTP